ncbi:hypothetical protein J8273_2455 [Carpediemonas membranifera]|uniref:Uncharacterized protein n=1 Tax=Carpediemonas membranifera TaxID=201153 RepID=A0A8J6AWS1_9EUKA|nr:hypothetical protein J8273_2455 [Carpediemonas membranifera]|eukprot:KAG9396103.1 hypothetical protein J8273_2455 [Carpediemonas membranifera]
MVKFCSYPQLLSAVTVPGMISIPLFFGGLLFPTVLGFLGVPFGPLGPGFFLAEPAFWIIIVTVSFIPALLSHAVVAAVLLVVLCVFEIDEELLGKHNLTASAIAESILLFDVPMSIVYIIVDLLFFPTLYLIIEIPFIIFCFYIIPPLTLVHLLLYDVYLGGKIPIFKPSYTPFKVKKNGKKYRKYVLYFVPASIMVIMGLPFLIVVFPFTIAAIIGLIVAAKFLSNRKDMEDKLETGDYPVACPADAKEEA